MDGLESVLVVNFGQDADAYEGLTDLKQLDAQQQIDLRAAVVVVRGEDGKILVKDEVADNPIEGTATGGIVGLLLGVIGGPFGILIGGSIGLLGGVLYDVDQEEHTESVLSHVSRSVRVGHPALLAEAIEESPEVVDTAMAGLGGTVGRYPAAEVEAEISAAEKAQRAAKKKARKELREQRGAKQKAEVHARVEELKARLRHQNAAAPASTAA
ncbi:MAG TPA: hypothetical protein VMI13_10260 [Solirubrobacteraceae bacterium]|nr:hypothetical protein [Solirubrobacteraceae bacterium]